MNKWFDVNYKASKDLGDNKERIYTPSYRIIIIYVPFFWRIIFPTPFHGTFLFLKG